MVTKSIQQPDNHYPLTGINVSLFTCSFLNTPPATNSRHCPVYIDTAMPLFRPTAHTPRTTGHIGDNIFEHVYSAKKLISAKTSTCTKAPLGRNLHPDTISEQTCGKLFPESHVANGEKIGKTMRFSITDKQKSFWLLLCKY